MKRYCALSALAALLAVAEVSSATLLFGENFNTDVSASWTTLAGPGVNDVLFAYDYSALGIPAAPGTADTLGLRMRANMAPGVSPLTGISTSPTGKSFTGDYVVQFYAWQNYGGTGTTQLTTYSVGATGNNSQRPGGTIDGIMFGSTSDGGSTQDYRAYGPGNTGAQLTGVYTLGSQNASATYAPAFPGGATSPAIQGPTQTSPVGTPAFTWAKVEITVTAASVVWELNDVVISTVPLGSITLAGSNISLGQSDINNTATNSPLLVFGLIDNLTVTQIPEPSSLGAVGAVAMLLGRRRR